MSNHIPSGINEHVKYIHIQHLNQANCQTGVFHIAVLLVTATMKKYEMRVVEEIHSINSMDWNYD